MADGFRFGVSLQSAGSRAEWRAKVRKTDELGFDVLTVPDHVTDGMLPPLVALCAAADASPRLRLGTLVLNNDLRHPALMAREATCLDLLSDGRFELGLGAGHMEHELASLGLDYAAAPERIDRLEEAVTVLRRLMDGEPLTHAGEHYTLQDQTLFPRPLQQPLPLLIGGNGRRVLELAARQASIVGFTGFFPTRGGRATSITHFSESGFEQRLAIVRNAAGARFDELELHALLQAVIVADDAPAAARKLQTRLPGLSVEEMLRSPFLLIGTHEQMAEALRERRERFGLSYFTCFEAGMEGLAGAMTHLC